MYRALILLALFACNAGGDDTETTDDTTETTDSVDTTPAGPALEDLIHVTTPATGDLTCAPGADGVWGSRTVDPSCITPVPLAGTIEDFQSGDPVGGLTVELFFSDAPVGEPSVTATSDADGLVTGGDVPTCTPWTSRAFDPADPEMPPALQMHWSESHKTPMNAFFNSVDKNTLALMNALLGVTPDLTQGFAAGTIYACGADHPPLAHAQVVLRKADGTLLADQNVRYFIEELPARDATETSEDGLFLAVNVPPGAYTIEAYAVLAEGEAPTLIAITGTQLLAGSFTVSDVYSGDDDGVVLPESCYAPCDPLP